MCVYFLCWKHPRVCATFLCSVYIFIVDILILFWSSRLAWLYFLSVISGYGNRTRDHRASINIIGHENSTWDFLVVTTQAIHCLHYLKYFLMVEIGTRLSQCEHKSKSPLHQTRPDDYFIASRTCTIHMLNTGINALTSENNTESSIWCHAANVIEICQYILIWKVYYAILLWNPR